VEATTRSRSPRLTAVLREGERVMPLELFFDLVFVLALTQCTALMADEPTWEGLAKGVLVLGVMWWSWVGYSWLTSVVDPEEGTVRLAMFAAMAALLVVALCIPGAFGDEALLFACAYAVVRYAQVACSCSPAATTPGCATRCGGWRRARGSAPACSWRRRSRTVRSRARCGRSRSRSAWAARC